MLTRVDDVFVPMINMNEGIDKITIVLIIIAEMNHHCPHFITVFLDRKGFSDKQPDKGLIYYRGKTRNLCQFYSLLNQCIVVHPSMRRPPYEFPPRRPLI